jgi:hypothetical protein
MAAITRGLRRPCIDGGNYFRSRPVGCIGIIHTNKFSNFVEVAADFRMEIVGDYEPEVVRRAAALFSLK